MAQLNYPRHPLSVPTAWHEEDEYSDGVEVIHPGHPDYEEEYRRAVRDHAKYGIPVPYHLPRSVVSESIPPYERARAILDLGGDPAGALGVLRLSGLSETLDDETWRQLRLLGCDRG